MPNIFFNRRFMIIFTVGLIFIFYLFNNRQSPHIDLPNEAIDQRHVNDYVNEEIKNGTITVTNEPAISGYQAYSSSLIDHQIFNVDKTNDDLTIKKISSENPKSTTSKHVGVGATKEQIVAAYGDLYTTHINSKLKTYIQYTDTKNQYSIQFHFKDDIVEKIVLEDAQLEYRLKKLISLPIHLKK